MSRIDEPLVLIAGHLCDIRLWMDQVLALSPAVRSVHVITPGPLSSVAALADEAETQLPPGKFAVAGFSLGGMIALELMARMPERITRLALIDTTGRDATLAEHALVQKNIAKVENGGLPAVVEKFITFLHAPAVQSDRADLVAATTEMMMSRAEICYTPQQIAMRDRPDRRGMLPTIACPTLVLCGALDLVTPPALHEEIAALVPGSTLTIVPDAGHMVTNECPEAVNGALRDWLGVASGAA